VKNQERERVRLEAQELEELAQVLPVDERIRKHVETECKYG